ncbi:MAG: alpha/beta fold hydrolase [Myxococcales bacterium]|nr:alpha/beta fold hydrolase [Myxococcales bacterium]
MKQVTWGGLSAVLTGGTDREGGGDGPLVVLLHGFGAPGTDLVPLWRVLDVPRGTRFVFPAGPLDLPLGFGDARAWWMIDFEAYGRALQTGKPRDLPDDPPPGLAEVRHRFGAFLTEMREALGPTPPIVGGFSQGAMVSLDQALHSDREIKGVALLSGSIPSKDLWEARFSSRAGLPVFQSHGKQDATLPFSLAEKLRDEMTAGGLEVTWQPFFGGHEIPQPVLDGLGHFITKLA